jgi:hypothetical protein
VFRVISLLALIILLLWGADQLYQKKTRFGLLSKFSSSSFSATEQGELPSPAICQILSQKFTYLARGSQAEAFVSEDGAYVLKLFKQHKWRPSHLWGYIPFSWNPYYKDFLKGQLKKHTVLTSCKAALLHIKEDTGVCFAHLNPTSLPIRSTTLIDKRGGAWQLDLTQSYFLLQKKADLFYPHIQTLMEQGNVSQAEYAITSMFKLLTKFIALGVFENNAILRKNFGFLDNEAMQFDIGKFKCDPTRAPDMHELVVITEGFHRWLQKNHPLLLSHFERQLTFFTSQNAQK